MIRLIREGDREHILRFCKKDKWNGTMIWSAFLSKVLDVNNVDWRYCDIWLGTADSQKQNPQYLLCRTGQTFYLAGRPLSDSRWEELHRFLMMNQGTLKADCRLTTEYRKRFPLPPSHKNTCHSGPRMICQHSLQGEMFQVMPCKSLWQFYDVLASEDQELAKHLSRDDFAARLMFQHRGGARSFEIRMDDRPVSVGTIVMPEDWEYSMIVNLCTLPEYRGRGYASQIVRRLCEESFADHKTPLLEGARESLEKYYRRLGFERTDYWQSMKLY